MSPTHFLGAALLFLIAFPPVLAVNFRVVDRTNYITGCNRFKTEIGPFYTRQLMKSASSFIWLTFDESISERKDHDQVTLIIYGFHPAHRALVSGTLNNTILINANYIQNYPGDARVEFSGILFHEMTHMWQRYGNGKAPCGLINGIADYIRLRAGLAPKEWVQRGSGSCWDEGYAVTAYFLDYCNGIKNGFVAELNRLMKDDYSDEFFPLVLGKTVDEFWIDYKTEFNLPVELSTAA
ncbi:hypothetical protein BT93_L2110 [Corymbia citriodora subsp. variegata]|uniref:Plant basic secretory protein (BSP) family protein n=1 Tax=Corymbia citriodora subsp. variegata TaxID=360336 RepID=A0A8T0CQZ9_CORYI|nr:hypothetical protein BT93_L2110 [Corymbia citriodora subsp. variegata]